MGLLSEESQSQGATLFLIEEKTISYVTSGREIVRLQRRSGVAPDSNLKTADTGGVKQAGSPSYTGKSLVMGNPDFDLDLKLHPEGRVTRVPNSDEEARGKSGTRVTRPSGNELAATRALSRDFRGLKFTPLPGSGMEATNVAKFLGPDAVLRLGAEAREADLKAVQSPRVLHLATHGFFLSDQDFKRTNSLRDSWAGNMGTRWNSLLPRDQW